MGNQKRLSILIVEDEVLIAEDIKDICTLAGYSVTEICYSGKQALSSIQKYPWDLVLLDVQLEDDITGLDVAEFIRLNQLKIPYIFITSFSDRSTLNSAGELQPVGYITKPFSREQLISSIEMGISYFNNLQERNLTIQSKSEHFKKGLSERESEIANLLCEGMNNEEIALKLYLSVNTIKYHIKSLYEKLGVSNRVQLIKALGRP